MKIGELAKASGIQTVTIRYYEKEGLLNAPSRSGANYSNYVLSNIAVSMAWLFPIFDSFWPTRIIHKPDVN